MKNAKKSHTLTVSLIIVFFDNIFVDYIKKRYFLIVKHIKVNIDNLEANNMPLFDLFFVKRKYKS